MEKSLKQRNFINEVRKDISLNKDLLELRKTLVSFKEDGMPQESMLDCLNELRNLEEEDLVLELMDFVEGFCNPNLRIYD